MKYYTLKNGRKLPAIGLGTWKSEVGTVGTAIQEALKAGYEHIDCAAIYQNEPEIGEALDKAFKSGIAKREDLWITSKLWNNAHQPENVIPALKKTLKDLRLDYLDLYLIHWPVAFKENVGFPENPDQFIPLSEVPILETWKKMEEAKDMGLVKSIGVSNFSIKKLQDLLSKAKTAPQVNQVELHPLLQQKELFEYCGQHQIILTGYSPLGTGNRGSGDKPNMLKNTTINEIADKHHCTPAQVLISWHLHRGTSVIPKSTNPERIKQNMESTHVELDSADIEDIAALDRHYRYIDGKAFEMKGSSYANIFDE